MHEAVALFEALARNYPRLGVPRALLGLTRCNLGDFDRGLADLHEGIALDPRNADLHCNLGSVYFAMNRIDEAETTLRRSLALAPAHADALNNLGLVLKARGDFAGALAASRRAFALRPQMAQARFNMSLPLLALGRFAEAWEPYAFRPHPRVNLRDAHLQVTVDHHARLPAAPTAIVLHGEQGLGDVLFFLRFAPELRRRGHRLAFWGDVRLHRILSRAGLFEHFMGPEATPGPGLTVLWVGDLPHLLGATDPAAFPPALPIASDEALRHEAQGRLQSLGPGPYIGLTWRAGLPRAGQVVISKNIEPADLASALAGTDGTVVSLQRNPPEGEIAQLAAALSRPVHDLGDVNLDLARALAMTEVLDDYVAVSNTNVHLRASAGRSARVLVPWPPDWRWLESGKCSPWFPTMPVYRQDRSGSWQQALERLSADLGGTGMPP